MKKLFEAVNLGGIDVKNRLVRSATFETQGAEDGGYKDSAFGFYEKLAKGGVGLIITGMVGIDENSPLPQMAQAWKPGFAPSFAPIAQMIHQNGCKVVVQLAHCGARAAKREGLPLMAPSENLEKGYAELTKEDIKAVAASFAASAANCKSAGADGVEIHAAHGYLLSQFLSPLFNRRSDEYGGPIENRARALFEVYEAVRAAVGPDYPVWLKINSSDYADGGLTLEESFWVMERIDAMGIDLIEVSGGIASSRASAAVRPITGPQDEACFADAAIAAAAKVRADIASVGCYRDMGIINEKLNAGGIKAISLARPFVSEPALAARWQAGDLSAPRCISCNKCFLQPTLQCAAFPE